VNRNPVHRVYYVEYTNTNWFKAVPLDVVGKRFWLRPRKVYVLGPFDHLPNVPTPPRGVQLFVRGEFSVLKESL
jgi:hypothetical protein